ncbi:hypothetical protein, partial [Pseudoduganella namucuonensis]
DAIVKSAMESAMDAYGDAGGKVAEAYKNTSATLADAYTNSKAGEQKVLVGVSLLIAGLVAMRAMR